VRIRGLVSGIEIPNETHGLGGDAGKAKIPKFDCSTFWVMIVRQFEAAAVHNHWTPREKFVHIQMFVQGQATDILHSVIAAT